MGLFSKHKNQESAPPKEPEAPKEDVQAKESQMLSNMPEVPQGANLSPPPLPGGSSLDGIKSEISPSAPQMPESSSDSEQSQTEPSGSSDDELFNMFDIDSPLDSNPSETSQDNEHSLEDKGSKMFDIEQPSELSFVKSHRESNPLSIHSKFLTTSQFKAMLELVEGVKSKVRDSTETYTRLMDIRSEEDIEYENLRKSFQFIEDKLYELDNILFEK